MKYLCESIFQNRRKKTNMHKSSESSGYTYSLWEALFYTMKYKIFRNIYHENHCKYTNILPDFSIVFPLI